MTTMNVKDATGATVAIEKPLAPGRAAAAASRPVVLSTEDIAALASETTQAAVLAKLSADPATQTTLAAVLAKLSADPATQTTLAAILAALATNHTDELQLHTDIATTLIAKDEAIRALLAGTLTAALPQGLGQKNAAGSTSVVLSSDGPFATNFGVTTDAAQTDPTQPAGLIALVKGLFTGIILKAGSAIIGKVGIDPANNTVTPASSAGTRVESTVVTGSTAVLAFSATPTNGWEIINPHSTEYLYVRENGTATVADNSINTPIAPRGSYTTPPGYKPTGDVSINAATSGHAFIARRW